MMWRKRPRSRRSSAGLGGRLLLRGPNEGPPALLRRVSTSRSALERAQRLPTVMRDTAHALGELASDWQHVAGP